MQIIRREFLALSGLTVAAQSIATIALAQAQAVLFEFQKFAINRQNISRTLRTGGGQFPFRMGQDFFEMSRHLCNLGAGAQASKSEAETGVFDPQIMQIYADF